MLVECVLVEYLQRDTDRLSSCTCFTKNVLRYLVIFFSDQCISTHNYPQDCTDTPQSHYSLHCENARHPLSSSAARSTQELLGSGWWVQCVRGLYTAPYGTHRVQKGYGLGTRYSTQADTNIRDDHLMPIYSVDGHGMGHGEPAASRGKTL